MRNFKVNEKGQKVYLDGFFASSFTTGEANARPWCVGVKQFPDGKIGVRDTKEDGGPVLSFFTGDWDAFTGEYVGCSLSEWKASWCLGAKELPNGKIEVHDTKNPGGPVLLFFIEEWDAFTKGLVNNEFNFQKIAT